MYAPLAFWKGTVLFIKKNVYQCMYIYVCMSVCKYVNMYVCMQPCVCECMYWYVCIRMYV
jgi:hypothetical protein